SSYVAWWFSLSCCFSLNGSRPHLALPSFPTRRSSDLVHSLYTRRKSRNSKLLAVAAYAVRNFTTCAACVVKLHVSENSANSSEEHSPCIPSRDAGLFLYSALRHQPYLL